MQTDRYGEQGNVTKNVQRLVRTTDPCGKDCMTRLRDDLDDPFTSVHELRMARFELTQK